MNPTPCVSRIEGQQTVSSLEKISTRLHPAARQSEQELLRLIWENFQKWIPLNLLCRPLPRIQICSLQRHFYLAVDRLQFKMETLVDLLGMAGQSAWLPFVVCCSTRDELDAVFSAVSNLSHISVSALHSDQREAERALVFEGFRQTTMNLNRFSVGIVDKDHEDKVEGKSHMIIVTDACLPLLNAGESPISARVLINYELPSKKETYIRRMNTCLAADGIVINMVVGGEVATLRSLEENSGLVIAEMPIHIFEMLSS